MNCFLCNKELGEFDSIYDLWIDNQKVKYCKSCMVKRGGRNE